MTWWQAIILGLVEGLTEYLPISSTGHLILVQRAMGIAEGKAADAYAICIQAGAIVAVLGLYMKRVRQMVQGLLGKDSEGLRLAINIVVAFLPAAVIGLALNKIIKEHLFNLDSVVIAWFVGGWLILLFSYSKRWGGSAGSGGSGGSAVSVDSGEGGERRHGGLDVSSLTWQMALVIGLAQCFALWPGTSRSLVTIIGGLLVGLSLSAAVEFSFLLGVVTLTAATAHDAHKDGQAMLHAYGAAPLVIGFIVAAVAAVFAVRWMVAYLNRHGLAIFGYYRVALAIAVSVLMLMGVLH